MIPNWSLGSTQAFDDLIDKGYCVEGAGGTPFAKPTGQCPLPGDPVKLSFVVYIWDSQAQALAEILASEDPDEGPMEFVVDEPDPSIIKAIHQGVKVMTKGLSVRLTAAPHMAYGAVGVPPLIPPTTHLVYDLKLEDFGATKPRKPSIIASVFSKGPKPDVEPRNRGSIRLMQPVVDRGAQNQQHHGHFANAVADHEAPQETKQPARRAGHVMLDIKPQANAAPGAPRPPATAPTPVKKYDYQVLKKMLADNVNLNALGIDRVNIEDYLNDSGFEEAFQMDKTQFLLKPKWRQVAAKRSAGLF